MDRNLTERAMDGILSVATREGGVDRNALHGWSDTSTRVATREGGVDRNVIGRVELAEAGVATREGGVDRNESWLYNVGMPIGKSPPARVAWIETTMKWVQKSEA